MSGGVLPAPGWQGPLGASILGQAGSDEAGLGDSEAGLAALAPGCPARRLPLPGRGPSQAEAPPSRLGPNAHTGTSRLRVTGTDRGTVLGDGPGGDPPTGMLLCTLLLHCYLNARTARAAV